MKYSILLCALLFGCSNPPSAKSVEVDLCAARAAFKALEVSDPSLAPAPGSLRAKIEVDEDIVCATFPQ